MARVLPILMTVVLGAVLSTTWLCIAVLARMDASVYLPQAVRFLGAALVLFLFSLVFARRLPQISLRLFHAAITVAALAYVLSPVLCFYSLRTLPSGLGALVYVSIPIWFLLAAYGEGEDRLYQHLILVVGLVLVYLGCQGASELRGAPWLPLLTLLCGMVAFMAGVWVSRRLFWLHSAMDLNFWSMLFGGLAHVLLAVTSDEFSRIGAWTGPYWTVLLYFAFGVTGLGAYFYRIRQGTLSSVLLTALTPILALVLGFLAWEETPLNVFTLAGGALVVGVLISNSLITRPNRWLVLYLNNDKRQGDRLVCLLQGELKRPDGTGVPIQVVDISIGGLGFRSGSALTVGEMLQVDIPVARQNNRLLLECRVAHVEPVESRDFPFCGGLEFRTVTESRWQSLVEFLARLAKAEEE